MQSVWRNDADVAVADIPDTLLQDTARAINDLGRRTLALSVDVTDTVQVEQMLRQVVETFEGFHGAAVREYKVLQVASSDAMGCWSGTLVSPPPGSP